MMASALIASLLATGLPTHHARDGRVSTQQRNADEVASLPGWSGALPSRHFSGFLAVANGTRQLHYYLQEADSTPQAKPLVLWLNGGPGASSLIGAFTELGQLIFNRDSAAESPPTLFRNPYAWTTLANVLYLEAPAGVGFSYCVDTKSRCENTDTSTAEQNHEALVAFLQRFPEYATRPFYLTGESYAGIYLPTLMDLILQRGAITTVRGLAIGNGCWGTKAKTNCGDVTGHPGEVMKIDAEYYAGRGLISPALKAAADAACGEWIDPISSACEAAHDAISEALGPFNIDNVDDFCPRSHTTTLTAHRAVGGRFARYAAEAGLAQHAGVDGLAAAAGAAAPPIGEVQMWCGAEAALSTWKRLPAVAEALHVHKSSNKFDYTIELLDLSPLYRRLAETAGLGFLIYNGQSDANVPYNGQVQYWAKNYTVLEEYKPWYRTGGSAAAAGHARTYQAAKGKTFQFVTVSGAGHEVPSYRPSAALTMLQKFVLDV